MADNKPKRKRGRPPKNKQEQQIKQETITIDKKENVLIKDNKVVLYDKTIEELAKKSFEEQKKLLTEFNKFSGVKILDEIAYQIINTLEEIYKTDKITFSEIDWISARYPDIEFIYSLLANMVVYGGKKGKLVIKINIEGLKYNKQKFENEVDIIRYLKNKVKNILLDNKLNTNLYHIAFNLIKYGFVVIYEEGSPRKIELYKPQDLDIRINNKIKSDNLYDKLVFIDKITGKELNKNKIYIISTEGIFGKPLFRNAYSYFRIINILENANFIERLVKSKTLFVWKVNVSSVEDPNAISLYISRIKQAITEKVSIEIDDENIDLSNPASLNAINVDISTALTNSHIIVPEFDKDGIQIETLKSDFKPIFEDIDRLWDKIYMIAQLPKYFSPKFDAKATPREFVIMQEQLASAKIIFYQQVINQFLNQWFSKLVRDLGFEFNNIDIKLDDYLPVSERKETDIEKAVKLINVFIQLEQVLGVPVKTDFILKKLFPEHTIDEIIDYDRLNNEVDTFLPENVDINRLPNEIKENLNNLGITDNQSLIEYLNNKMKQLKETMYKETENIYFEIDV